MSKLLEWAIELCKCRLHRGLGREQTVTHRSSSTTFDNFIRIYQLPFARPNYTGSAHRHRYTTNGITHPFNIYVALSRSRLSRGRDSIWLLRDFEEKFLTMHPNEYLRIEDARLARMDEDTKKKKEEKRRQMDDSVQRP